MLIHIRRREFIVTLGGVACAWPLAARAQQPAMPVIGWLGTDSREVENSEVVSFQQGLKETGYIEGQNLAIEYRWAEGQYDRLPALAADLVRRQVTVIATSANAATLAAKAATTTVPIVFQVGFDPVQVGLVASLNRPGGNATGVTSLNTEVGPKKLELLHELVPNVAVIGLLVNPDNPYAEIQSREAQAAARKLGLELHIVHARTERDFDAAFATLVKLRAGALVIGPDPIFFNRSRQLGALALRYAVPAISPYRDFAAGGGLMSYGTNIADLFRQVGIYTGRILKGEKAADLPVQQAVKVDLVLNFKTAKTLGITVPLPLSGRADEVIE
jgi:putative tryptophan/tyrosine transport system substrate-binding protein